MAKKIQKAQNNTFIEKYFGSLGGAITIIIACIGAGFAFGRYYEKITLDAKIRELENKQQIQIIEYREKIFELHKEVIDLKNENFKLQLTKDNNENEK